MKPQIQALCSFSLAYESFFQGWLCFNQCHLFHLTFRRHVMLLKAGITAIDIVTVVV